MEKYKILYADNEFINLELFEINLKKKYSVLIAESGMDGFHLLSENPCRV